MWVDSQLGPYLLLRALVRVVGAGTRITERAHSTFFRAPSGAATALANFLHRLAVLQQDGVKAQSDGKE